MDQQPKHSIVIIHRIWNGRNKQDESIEIVVDGEMRYKDGLAYIFGWSARDRSVYGALRQVRVRNFLPVFCEQFGHTAGDNDHGNIDVDFGKFLEENGVTIYYTYAHVPNQYDL